MAGKNTAVFGIYPNRAAAEQGVDALLADGFRNEDLSVLMPENMGTGAAAAAQRSQLR